MQKISILAMTAALLATAAAGCRKPPVAELVSRSTIKVKVAVTTKPEGASVYEGSRLLGVTPLTLEWTIEKVQWSDGKVSFFLLPERTRIKEGEELTKKVSLVKKGFKPVEKHLRMKFEGKPAEKSITVKLEREKG